MIPPRYNKENLTRLFNSPGLILGELNQICVQINEMFHDKSKNNCTKVWKRDWDNLIILDACRYDAFHDTNDIEGKLERVESCGSNTEEFILSNFQNQTLHDCVYISANGHISSISNDVFHDVFHVYEDGWDDELETVPPEKVTESAVHAHQQYPNKRLIVHFIQPHAPFIGDFGQTIPHTNVGGDDTIRTIWTNLQYGITSTDISTAKEGYIENLSLALEEVKRLLSVLTGKTVITADHGELMGERLGPIPVRGYGHPRGIYKDELVQVPWLVINSDERKTIESEPPQDQSVPDQDTINDQLRALGYVT